MNSFIESQNWRYATKKFDADKKISAHDLLILKEAIRLATSSYGLQPYKVFIVENEEIRKELQPASWGQSQITEASHLFIFANYTEINKTKIDNYFNNIINTRNLSEDAIQGYKNFVQSKISELSQEELNIWTAKQTYLALGNLINAAADLKIDVTPMEGFEPQKYNTILGLTERGLNASLVATVGYRHHEDKNQFLPKVRKSIEDLFETI